MNKFQINNIHRKVVSMIYSGKLYDAAAIIKSQEIYNVNDSSSPLAMVEQTYSLMLKYTIDGMVDPNRAAIFRQLQITLLMMADAVRNAQMKKFSPSAVFNKLAHNLPIENPNDNNIPEWFDYILRCESISGDEFQILENFCKNENSWKVKCLIVSALTLSSLISFDIKKYSLLTMFYLMGEPHVWQRALVGLVILSYYYNKRLKLYPETQKFITQLVESKMFRQRYEATVIQLIRAIDTDKITKRINEEILPEVSKIPGIKSKMKSDSIILDNLDEKNPQWKDYIEDNHELFDKLSEMSKLQMEGSDVFINTFAVLKNYSFFDKIENWFMPFTSDCQVVKELSQQKNDDNFDYVKFAKSLSTAPFICNSDKFSFCLSVGMMPQSQRTTLGKYFNGTLKEMSDFDKEEQLLHREEYNFKSLVQYIQDLYRFFKLNTLGKEFIDIFDKGFSPSGTMLFDEVFSAPSDKRNVGEFFFKSEYYNQAFDIFQLISLSEPQFEVFQKMGYSAQKIGDIEKALDCYLKAQLFDNDQLWNLKKIGWCYRKLKNPAKALEYYQKAEKLDLNNLAIATAIGRCFLELENYNEALKYYFKVEFLDVKNTKVFRPIAWCSYQVGKYEQSIKYCNKILDSDRSPEDLVLIGHNYRMMGQLRNAVEYYKKAINSNDFDIQNLEEAISTDYKPENQEGLSEENNLILDFLAYSNDGLC